MINSILFKRQLVARMVFKIENQDKTLQTAIAFPPHSGDTCISISLVPCTGLQIYGGPGSLSHDFKIWPITFQGSGPSGPILLVVKISHFDKNIHLTASLQIPQNRSTCMLPIQ